MLEKTKKLEVKVISSSPKLPLEKIDLDQYAGILLENKQVLVFGDDYFCYLFGEELYGTSHGFLPEHATVSEINEIIEEAFGTKVERFLKEIKIRVEV